jgi:lysophospholipase L1-like esterase
MGLRSADIIALGDSFVEGNAVADRYTFPSKLQDYIHSGGYQEHVVNMGIGGYGTDQEFKLLHIALDRGARPKVVLWALFNNDVYENYTQAVYDISDVKTLVPIDPSKNWLYIRQQIVDRLPVPKSWKLHSYVINLFLSGFEKFNTAAVPKKFTDHPDIWATQKIAKAFDETEALAKQYDFQLVYVLIAPQAIYMPDPKNMQWAMDDYAKLQTLLVKRPQTIYVDFRYLSNPRLEDALYLDSRRDSLPKGQRHFNEKGYEQFAQVVFSYLEMHNMLKKQ